MRRVLTRRLAAFALCVAVWMCALVTGGMYLVFRAQLKAELVSLSSLLAAQLNAASDPAQSLAHGIYTQRVTLVDAEGAVLFDSHGSATAMDNHLGREEIIQAARAGEGWAVRASDTLGETSIYYARRLSSGAILRVAGTQASVLATLGGMLRWLIPGAAVCVAASVIIARALARRLVRPLNAIDPEHPMDSAAYEELSPLLGRMDRQNRHIAAQLSALSAQRAELDAVLDGMREGLVILDAARRVLTMNPAARSLLDTQGNPVGQPLTAVCRQQPLLDLMNAGQGKGEMRTGARILHLSLSPVKDAGTVLLLQDVTQARQAEEIREQFSANVSHELRTPLTTISGYAEMLASGMANPEDAGVLGDRILQESRRMLALMEDILRLSRMDEGHAQEARPVALDKLAADCADKLREAADRLGVTVHLRCAPATVMGDAALLAEMIANLIENAIKYNRPQGSVTVETGLWDGHPRLTVRDTGVGIPPEHQARVFERFYRVDKSRSKQTGGTGLGLSIVKHVALLHHADITLKSQVGVGTDISLTF